ncbi:alpha-(1,3)-fucosyltransferase 7-like, partial [Diadema antillarum]|uniref:alpha-(1,3)-fucosyltransferase 7-like n=1 Tax=Diadema antillarum TaxID=105358 RepID=UPI003A854DB1
FYNIVVVAGLMTVTVLGILTAMWTTPAHRSSRYAIIATNSSEYQALIRKNTGCVKKVHIFGTFSVMKHIPEISHYMELFIKSTLPLNETGVDCMSMGYDCDISLTMGDEINMLKGKDAVVFGLVPTQFRGEGGKQLRELVNRIPEPGQYWIYFSTESPLRVMRWTADLNLGRLKYHLLMTYDSDSDIVLPFGYYRPFNTSNTASPTQDVFGDVSTEPAVLEDQAANRKGLISWMASNCRGFWPRVSFVRHMKELLPLDDYGRCGRSECLPKRSDVCNKLLASYKFILSIPNTECKEYITEKFWLQSLTYGAVPVVLGSKKETYEKLAPPNSFIHAADFGSFDELAAYLKMLDADDDKYRQFYEWKKQGEVVLTYPTRPSVFCQAIPFMKVQRKRIPFKYLSDSPWFNGCRLPVDRRTFDLTKDEENELMFLENWTVWR